MKRGYGRAGRHRAGLWPAARGLFPEGAAETAVPIVVACLVAIGILGVFMVFTPGSSQRTTGGLGVGMSPDSQPHVADGLGVPLPQLPLPQPRHTARAARHDPRPHVVVAQVSAPTPSAHPTPPSSGNSAGRESPIAVSYIVNSLSASSFLGQVQVTNFGARPLGGWQIVVALNGDVAVSFTNASGYQSNGIILLHPVSSAEVVPAHGTLSVYFLVDGAQTQPITCAFNGIVCGTTT